MIDSHDLREFQAVQNVDETLMLAGIQTEAGIAFVGGKDGLVGVVGFHEQGGGLTPPPKLPTRQRMSLLPGLWNRESKTGLSGDLILLTSP